MRGKGNAFVNTGALPPNLSAIIADALDEDGAHDDATTGLTGISGTYVTAVLVTGAPGVVAGLDVARGVFAALDSSVVFESVRFDGNRVSAGETIARVSGDAAAVLGGERVALNFVQRLSGIATLTAAFVERVAETGVTILDTRKTTPLLRALEKYAVTVGGGTNHRFNLTDMILIKENHVRAAGGLSRIAELVAHRPDSIRVEIEVDSLDMLERVLSLDLDRVMLDNFSPDQVGDALDAMRRMERRVEVEVSGGVTLDNIDAYAIPGVDFISIGALTHNAPWLDISLEVLTSDD